MSGGAPLLEREVELHELEGLLSNVQASKGRLALVEGEAGIGKTRLLAATREIARARGFTVLSARGSEHERGFAFGIVRQLLEPALRTAGLADRELLMAGAARFSAAVFDESAADVDRSGDPSYAVLHGLYWLVANLADRGPMVLAIDDAHWADRPSLRFVAFLARRLEGMGVLVVLAGRRGEPGAEADLLRALGHELGVRPIQPRLLSEEAVAQLVQASLAEQSSGALCAACHAATRGNPFLVSELLVELAEQGRVDAVGVGQLVPRGVVAAVLARLDRLPDSVLALARAVAVLGDRCDLALASALAAVELGEASAAADLLADAGILERGRPLRFAHPLVRGAIYEELPLSQRSAAHARAARLLSAQDAGSESVAVHLLATEPAADAWVVQTLRKAARAAMAIGAPEVAASYLRRALAEPPTTRAEVLVELGAAEARAGEAGALEHLAAARALATDPWCAALAAIELSQVLAYVGKAGEAAAIAIETLAAISDQPDAAKAVTMLLLVLSQIDLAARAMTPDLLLRARRTVERRGSAAPRSVLAIVASERVMVDGTAAEVAELGQFAVDGDHRIDEATLPQALCAAVALALVDRGDAAERELTSAIADALGGGWARGFAAASAMRAWSRYRAGALVGAEADARAALDITHGDPRQRLFQPPAVSALVDVLVERGELAAARAALAEHDISGQALETVQAQSLRESRARLRMAEGMPREALAELAAYADWETAWGASNGVLVQWRSAAALAHHALGEREHAQRLIGEELALAQRFGAARVIGIALSVAGVLDDEGLGVERLREAVDLLEGSDARLEHARALVRLGALTRRGGHRTAAREPLRSGLDLAARLGASALAQTARQELLATGARPRRAVLTGRDALTPSERRVAEAAAAGPSNREIAQSLFLTVRTIEMHLSNAYRKLDIRSRDQLRAALQAD